MTTTSATLDLWYHYGRRRAAVERGVPEDFRWAWVQDVQDAGPGAEVLGDLTGLCVADLGAGAGRHAAYLAVRHRPGRVDAVDASAAQHAMARDLFADRVPCLRLVHADVVAHLRTAPGAYDVLFSVFGALDFTDPRDLLPLAAAALRPGGRLVFSTLAHYPSGERAEADVTHADVSARGPNGEPATMRRWVLREHVWVGLLEEAGFADIDVEVLPASAESAPCAQGVATLLLCARSAPHDGECWPGHPSTECSPRT
nr:class I SAM-dependent methyltransferase [Streptomyces sp. NBRC 109706]